MNYSVKEDVDQGQEKNALKLDEFKLCPLWLPIKLRLGLEPQNNYGSLLQRLPSYQVMVESSERIMDMSQRKIC